MQIQIPHEFAAQVEPSVVGCLLSVTSTSSLISSRQSGFPFVYSHFLLYFTLAFCKVILLEGSHSTMAHQQNPLKV